MNAQTRIAVRDTGIVLAVFALLLAVYLVVAAGYATPWSPIGTQHQQPATSSSTGA